MRTQQPQSVQYKTSQATELFKVTGQRLFIIVLDLIF